MAKEKLLQVIKKAITDKEFADNLFTNCDEAVKGFNLSKDEINILKNIKCDNVEKFKYELENRLSKDDGWWVGSVQD